MRNFSVGLCLAMAAKTLSSNPSSPPPAHRWKILPPFELRPTDPAVVRRRRGGGVRCRNPHGGPAEEGMFGHRSLRTTSTLSFGQRKNLPFKITRGAHYGDPGRAELAVLREVGRGIPMGVPAAWGHPGTACLWTTTTCLPMTRSSQTCPFKIMRGHPEPLKCAACRRRLKRRVCIYPSLRAFRGSCRVR
jgi:hypothetical protein